MARIKQLSKHLINQIAAGEVIERPASVVKELVENSIDAGATKISVEITNDCRDIRVADNGSGIHPEDIVLAFSKHATSKLQKDEDLFEIQTLGFRGEALASIISISKLTCTTRTKDFETGTKVKCENSEVKQVETGCAIGTIMDIKDLFYNVPVRLKFLRNPNTEFSYIQEIVQSLALINTNISFELKKFGKTVLKTTGQGNLNQTIKEIYSSDMNNNLKSVLKTDEISGLKIFGLISKPDFTRSSKKDYHLYINSRSVKCPVIQKSIDMVYKTLIANGKYPFVILNVEIPPHDVDVNVHPTKKEVRYKNTNQIFNFVRTAVEGGLANYVEQTPTIQNVIEFRPQHSEIKIDKEEDTMYVSDFMMKKIEDEVKPILYAEPKPIETLQQTSQQTFIQEHFAQEEEENENIIGQYKNTYILIETPEGLEIVDQHIAQERFIYEKLKSEKQVASQILFISDVVEVAPSDIAIIKENLEKFEKFGFGIEIINDHELVFRKVPVLIAKVNPKDIIADILSNIEGDIDNLEERILITTSCKASVKANQKLTMWQMQEIIKNWRTTKMPYTCPHGRPISHIIAHKDIAHFFERQK